MSTMCQLELPPEPCLKIARRMPGGPSCKKCSCHLQTLTRPPRAWAAAQQHTRPRTTNGKRTNHPDAPGNDTNGNTHPTPRPRQKRTPTSNFRTTSPEKQNTHKQLSDNSPGKTNPPKKRKVATRVVSNPKKPTLAKTLV